MKKLFILLLFITSCGTREMEDNQITKTAIDSLSYSECWLTLEVDSADNIIDTINLIQYKFDDEKNLVFTKKEFKSNGKDYLNKIYFWEDGTDFLSILYSKNGDFREVAEVFRFKNGEPQYLINRTENKDVVDSLLIEYEFDYNLWGKKKRLILKMIKEDMNVVHSAKYNRNEKAVSESTIINQDTFERKIYSYSSGELIKIEHRKTSPSDTTMKSEFFSGAAKHDSTLNYVFEEGKKLLNMRTVFYYDKHNVYKGYDEINFAANSTKKVILEKIVCELD